MVGVQGRNDKTEVISETQRETRLAGDKEEGSAGGRSGHAKVESEKVQEWGQMFWRKCSFGQEC